MSIKKTVSLLCVLLLLISCLFGCAKTGIVSQNKNVAVITKGSESDFWNDVKSGALSAANEYNINITVDGPNSEEDYKAQNKLIEEAISNNVGAIILSARIIYRQAKKRQSKRWNFAKGRNLLI